MRIELSAASIAFFLLSAASSALGPALSQGDVRPLSLLPLPAVALAAWSVTRRLPRRAHFFRVFAWSMVGAIGIALTGIAGGFTPFGWYVALGGAAAAMVHRSLATGESSPTVMPALEDHEQAPLAA